MDLIRFESLVTSLSGVRRRTVEGAARWELQGRLIARQMDETHVVIRMPFDVRDAILRQHPDVFSVPSRYQKHMLVVADLTAGQDGAIEDALETAWLLQSSES